jgi:hypothetical protein
LVNRAPDLTNAIVGYGVMMPDITFSSDGPDIVPKVLFDARDITKPIPRYFERLATYWHDRLTEQRKRPPIALSAVNRSDIIKRLRNDFELSPSLATLLGQVNQDLIALTDEQLRIFRDSVENDRILVRGGAGTGKTMLALAEARRLAADGKRVLLCCFNKRLAQHLSAGGDLLPNLDIRHLHGCMIELIDRAGLRSELPQVEAEDLFRVVMPTVALRAVDQLELLDHYDALIVDEGQDLLLECYLDFLESMLKGSFHDGIWRLFHDPNQNIYGATAFQQLARLRNHRPAEFRLSINCRNTAPIATNVAILSGIAPDTVLRAEGPQVEFYYYRDDAHQRRELEKFLNRTISDGIDPRDIIILSRLKTPSFIKNGLLGIRFPVVELTDSLESQRKVIQHSTIASFKGLERDVVAVADLQGIASAEMAMNLYVGTSRAKSLLALFIPESEREDVHCKVRDFAKSVADA